MDRIPGYLKPQEATALYDALKLIKWDTLYAPARFGGNPIRRKTKTFYEGDLTAATSYMNAYGDKGAQPIPFTSAPQELVDLRERLQKKTGLNLSLCYINFYWDGRAQIGWHQDREEHGSPDVLPMVTVYGSFGNVTRPLSVLEMKGNTGKNAWAATTDHGDLVVMPVGFHDNYFHCVLTTEEFAKPRISLTFRNPDLSPTGKWRWYGLKPQVWEIHAGKEYPPDAVYVGCRTVRGRAMLGTPFGNAKNPLTAC